MTMRARMSKRFFSGSHGGLAPRGWDKAGNGLNITQKDISRIAKEAEAAGMSVIIFKCLQFNNLLHVFFYF